MSDTPSDALPDVPAGVVELREDVPLKSADTWGSGVAGRTGWCAGGPRLALATFAMLSAAITLALITQLYFEDYEAAAHGAVSSGAEVCSVAGTDALKAGGRAVDAAAVTALCLAVVAPHATSIDASGSLVYWEYRQKRTQSPLVVEWGPSLDEPTSEDLHSPILPRPPRLLFALATLHARLGALPWPRLLQPALQLATKGFPVSEALAAASGGAKRAGEQRLDPTLARYLATLQHNTSAELSEAWAKSGGVVVHERWARLGGAGTWHVVAGGARAAATERALQIALGLLSSSDVDAASLKAVAELQSVTGTKGPGDAGAIEGAGAVGIPGSTIATASGVAVVDPFDTYLALVTGLSVPFGSELARAVGGAVEKDSEGGWMRDEPSAPLDLAPAIMFDQHVCGTRFVIGAESSAALAQAGVALAWDGATGVERKRAAAAGGTYASVNVVQQRGDELLSHAESRGGGIASRF